MRNFSPPLTLNLRKLEFDQEIDRRTLVNVFINVFGIFLVSLNFVSVVDYEINLDINALHNHQYLL